MSPLTVPRGKCRLIDSQFKLVCTCCSRCMSVTRAGCVTMWTPNMSEPVVKMLCHSVGDCVDGVVLPWVWCGKELQARRCRDM